MKRKVGWSSSYFLPEDEQLMSDSIIDAKALTKVMPTYTVIRGKMKKVWPNKKLTPKQGAMILSMLDTRSERELAIHFYGKSEFILGVDIVAAAKRATKHLSEERIKNLLKPKITHEIESDPREPEE